MALRENIKYEKSLQYLDSFTNSKEEWKFNVTTK